MPDIRKNFAQLDQRLADLREQLSGPAEDPAPPQPLAPPPERRPLPEPTLAAAAAGEDPGSETAEGTEAADPTGAADLPNLEGIEQLGTQIEQLLTVRDQLLSDARELVRAFERRLDELESQGTISVTVSAPPPRPAFFEGMVALVVSGASRIQTIQVLEDSLARIPHVERTYIRRWHAGQLWVELTLSDGVELIGELNRVLPFPFAVRSATGQEIALSVEEEGG
ncbi:MAG: hypothetical protein ACJ764_05785 [Solirubrobacteraceae bacterium]